MGSPLFQAYKFTFVNVTTFFALSSSSLEDKTSSDIGKGVGLLDLDGSVSGTNIPKWILSNETASVFPANQSIACENITATSLCSATQVSTVVQLKIENAWEDATDLSTGRNESIPILVSVYPFSPSGNTTDTPTIPIHGRTKDFALNGTRTVFEANVWTRNGYAAKWTHPKGIPPALNVSLEGAAPGDWIILAVPWSAETSLFCDEFKVLSDFQRFECTPNVTGVNRPGTYSYDPDHQLLYVRIDALQDPKALQTMTGVGRNFTYFNTTTTMVTLLNSACTGFECGAEDYFNTTLPTTALLSVLNREALFSSVMTLNKTFDFGANISSASLSGNSSGSAAGNASALGFNSTSPIANASFAYDAFTRTLTYAIYHNIVNLSDILTIQLEVSSAVVLTVSPLHANPIRGLARLSILENSSVNATAPNGTGNATAPNGSGNTTADTVFANAVNAGEVIISMVVRGQSRLQVIQGVVTSTPSSQTTGEGAPGSGGAVAPPPTGGAGSPTASPTPPCDDE
jgi:hypothetical protein